MDDLHNGFAYKGSITVPSQDFSSVVTITAQKRDHIISVGFKPTDNTRHDVYPVWLAPADANFKKWQICFYNNESDDVEISIFGIEMD